MESDTFPLLMVIGRSRGSLELLDVIEGKSTPDEVVSTLMHSNDSFEKQRQRDVGEETVREQREELKRQQEAEYSRSLAADQAKERVRQDDERLLKEMEKAKEQVKQQRLVGRSFLYHRPIEYPCLFEATTKRLSSPPTRRTK